MDLLEGHSRAQDTFARVLARVSPNQYGECTPCEEWTVHDLVEHVVGGNNRTAAGHPGSPVGQPALDGLVEGADPTELFTASAQRAQSVFAAPDGLAQMFELPFGSLPGSVVIGMRTTDVLVHAWDLAVATSQATDLDPELAQSCLETARDRLQESFRGPGRPFGAAQECPRGRPVADELAAFMGRRLVIQLPGA
jgi:uncharacterized protein (TIGR03086 family)